MSHSETGSEALGSTATGTTTAGVAGAGSGSAVAAVGMSSVAAPSRRRSSGRCQIPWRPGRLAIASASKRIAPGRGHSSAAVVDE
jgi:hypothetical protein